MIEFLRLPDSSQFEESARSLDIRGTQGRIGKQRVDGGAAMKDGIDLMDDGWFDGRCR